MAKKKDGTIKASVDTPKTTTETTTEEASSSTALSTQDAYQRIFIPARDKMIESIRTLARTADDTTKSLLLNLARSVNPQKKGREEMSGRWVIPTIRIVYGTTKEKPDGAEAGDLITTSGFILKQPLKITPLYTYEQNRMFSDSVGGAPLCFAPDAKLGRPFGVCNACANLPRNKNITRTLTACDNGICFIVLSQDLKLYRIEFFKTSFKAGRTLDDLASATPAIWDRWFSVKSQLQMGGGHEWHIFKVSSANEETPDWVRDAADILYDLIYAERKVFLAQHYALVEAGEQDMSTVNENVDVDSLGIAEGTDDNPDLSTGGI